MLPILCSPQEGSPVFPRCLRVMEVSVPPAVTCQWAYLDLMIHMCSVIVVSSVGRSCGRPYFSISFVPYLSDLVWSVVSHAMLLEPVACLALPYLTLPSPSLRFPFAAAVKRSSRGIISGCSWSRSISISRKMKLPVPSPSPISISISFSPPVHFIFLITPLRPHFFVVFPFPLLPLPPSPFCASPSQLDSFHHTNHAQLSTNNASDFHQFRNLPRSAASSNCHHFATRIPLRNLL